MSEFVFKAYSGLADDMRLAKKRSVLWQHAFEGGGDELTVISDRGFFFGNV